MRVTDEMVEAAIREWMRHTGVKAVPFQMRPTLEAALAAAPQAEPVAKVELMTTGGNAGLATRIVEIDDHLRERLRPGQLLYTAPPAPDALREAARMAMESIRRLTASEDMTYLRGSVALALVEAEDALEDALRAAAKARGQR